MANILSERNLLLRELHTRILAGDPEARAALAEQLLPTLLRKGASAFRRASRDVINDAVTDALTGYWLNPQMFDLARGVPLEFFLYQATWRNIVNLNDAEARRRANEAAFAKQILMSLIPEHEALEGRTHAWSRVAGFGVLVEPGERAALRSWLNGERSVGALARLLGLSRLSEADQIKEVKRFKDRIGKRLARLGQRKHARTLDQRRHARTAEVAHAMRPRN